MKLKALIIAFIILTFASQAHSYPFWCQGFATSEIPQIEIKDTTDPANITVAFALATTGVYEVASGGKYDYIKEWTTTAGHNYRYYCIQPITGKTARSAVSKYETYSDAAVSEIDTSTELQARFTEIKGAGWTTETLKDIKDAIATIAPATGARQVTTQLYLTGTTTPITDVNIQVYNSTQTVLLTASESDTLGQKVFALDDATYKVRLNKAGYTFTVPETIIVTADSTKTLYGDAVNVGTPASASNIRVYDWFFAQDDSTPATTVTATAKIATLPYNYNGKIHIGDNVNITYSSATGLGYWDIVKGATVEFKSDKFFGTKTKKIPTTGTTIRLSEIH